MHHNPALPARGRSKHPDSPYAMRGVVSGEGREVRSVQEEDIQERCEAASV